MYRRERYVIESKDRMGDVIMGRIWYGNLCVI